MNLGDAQVTDGVSPLLEVADDADPDPHLVRVQEEAGDEDSDEEVKLFSYLIYFLLNLLFGLYFPIPPFGFNLTLNCNIFEVLPLRHWFL